MVDPRVKQLAGNLIRFSCKLKQGEHVLIEAYDGCLELVRELVHEAYRAGALPHVWLRDAGVNRALALGAKEEQLALDAKVDALLMENM